MYSFDIVIQNYFASGRTEFLTEFFYLLTTLFDADTPLVVMCFFVCVLIYLVRGVRFSLLFMTSIFLGGVFSYILKYLFDIARPANGVISAAGQSFPSSHATVATVFFVMLMCVFDDYLTGTLRKIFNFFCILGIFLVALSRVYLGVHWASDVIGGVVLGSLVSYLCIKVFRKN